MSIEEWPTGELVIKGGMNEYIAFARELFNKKEYIGAFARIDALLEVWMENLYELHETNSKIRSPEEYEKTLKGYRFESLRSSLIAAKLISGEEGSRILKFHELRNRIVHKLVKYSFRTHEWYIVRKDEPLPVFEEGVALARLLDEKCGGMWTMTVFLKPKNMNDAANK